MLQRLPLGLQLQQVLVLVSVPQYQMEQMALLKTVLRFGGNERVSQHLHAVDLAIIRVSVIFQSSTWHSALYVHQSPVYPLHSIVT